MRWRLICLHLMFVSLALALPSWSQATEPESRCKQLIVSANADYFPYSWQSTTDPNSMQGAMIDLVKRLTQEAQIDIQIKYIGPWARTQKEVYSGNADLIAGAFLTQHRTKFIDYLYPELTKTQTVIWVNRHNSFVYQQLSDLIGKAGGTIINNSLGQMFDDYAAENLLVHELSNIEQGFKMLDAKRLDYVIYEKEPSAAIIKQLNIDSLTYLQPAVSQENLHLVISKASPCNTKEIRKRLTQALQVAQKQNWAAQYLEATSPTQ